jgi:photosystem II stability/assembly factor-like uncharacterized protein
MTVLRNLLLAIAIAASLAACAARVASPPTRADGTIARPDAPGERAAFNLAKRLPPGADAIPVERYLRAGEAAANMRRYSTRLGRWVDDAAQAKSAGARWEWLGPTNVGGRGRTLEFDPRDPNRMLLAGVSGGVWESTDAGASWRPLSDDAANLNIGALAIDPVEPDTIYAGTGELYRNNQRPYSAMWGQGVLRSSDGGQTFRQLLATANDDFRYVSDVVVSRIDHRRVYVASNTGVWRSRDAGATFEKLLAGYVGDQFQYEGCTDLLLLPDAGRDVLLASCSSRSTDDRYYLPGTVLPPACPGPCPAAIFRNDDAAGSAAFQPVLSETAMGRTSMDYARSNPNVVYAISASIAPGPDRTGDGRGDYENGLHAVWRSSDGGRTWQARLRNSSSNVLSTYLLSYADGFEAPRCGFGGYFIYGAGWYNQAIAVNPVNENVVWVAGMEHYRSDDGGTTFGKASYWWLDGSAPQGAHADQHLLKFHPNYDGVNERRLYSPSDGGLSVTLNDAAPTNRGSNAACGPASGTVAWQALENGLGTTQFYTGAVTADGRMYMGGLQDNGTLLNRSDGASRAFDHIYGGDGASVLIDPRNRDVIYASAQNVSLGRSENGGVTFVDATGGLNDVTIFIMPVVLDAAQPDRLYAGGSRLWRSANRGTSWSTASSVLGSSFATRISAIAVAPTRSDHVLFGNQVAIYRSIDATATNGTTEWLSTAPRGGWVSSLEFDPLDANVAYATYSTFGGEHVWKSTDAGTTWQAIDGVGAGRLPDVPVHTIAIDPNARDHLYIGSDVGIFVSLDGGSSWALENAGFANVIVEKLAVAPAASPPELFAFTYGRGVWRVPLSDLVGDADYRIGADTSGAFYDPAQDGHGWFVESIVDNGVTGVLAAWYTYLNGEQRWLIGNATADGDRVRVPLYIGRDGQFPPSFDPATTRIEPWGEVELVFDDRDHAIARWTTTYPGFASGQMPLVRLSQPAAGEGTSGSGQIAACHAGAWYNAQQSGHGLQVQVLGNGSARQLLAIWYTYLDGAQRWLIGQGPISGDSAELAVQITSGGQFPPNFDPASVQRTPWGTLRFRAIDANRARIDWTTTAPGFTSGGLDLTRLTTDVGRACP